MKRLAYIFLMMIIATTVAKGQSRGNEVDRQECTTTKSFAVKTNLLYDLVLTPNIGVEVSLGEKYSVAANWMYAWWHEDAEKWYHRTYGGDVELRRYFGTKGSKGSNSGKKSSSRKNNSALQGFHVGVYGQMLQYDFEWGDKGYLADTWSWAGGIAAGWSKGIGKHLNLDFTLGVGYLTGEYEEYKPIDDCYVWQATKVRHWIGPTKAEVSLVWLIKQW